MKKTINSEIMYDSDDDEIKICIFCKKKAESRCSICLEATYCTPQHQRADWNNHKKICTRPEQKLKELNKQLLAQKRAFFDKLTKNMNADCESICQKILKISRQIVLKFPITQHEIQYGSAVCCYVKMLHSARSLNEAQQNLTNYTEQKINFLKDTSFIPQKIKAQNPKYKQILLLVQGKLKLLSVLSNLTHQIIRNSMHIVEILLNHCVKFYGEDSLQVSNVYSEMANYYHELKQDNKAIACFLVAGKIRKQKGVSAFYNASILLMRNTSYHKALKLLLKCLEMVQNTQDNNSILDSIYLGLAFCYKKLNHFDNTVQYLQKALCQVTLKRKQGANQQNIRVMLKLLSEEYKKQFNNDQILSLPRQVSDVANDIVLTNSNMEDFYELNVDNTKKKREQQWLKSFKNQTDKTKYVSKIPMTNNLVEKVLFFNQFTDQKNQETSQLVGTKINMIAAENINVDLRFITSLSSDQIRYLNELSKLLALNKQKSAIFNIVENSNFIAQLNKQKKKEQLQKIERFYQMNPQLLKDKQDINWMESGEEGQNQSQSQLNQEIEQNKEKDKDQPKEKQKQKDKPEQDKQKQKTPIKGLKLDLQKMIKMRELGQIP